MGALQLEILVPVAGLPASKPGRVARQKVSQDPAEQFSHMAQLCNGTMELDHVNRTANRLDVPVVVANRARPQRLQRFCPCLSRDPGV